MIRCACLLAAFLLSVTAAPVSAQSPLVGAWDGAIRVMGQEIEIHVTFVASGDALKATISVPAQGASGLPLSNVKASADTVHFELPAGPGLAVFEGTLKGELITGPFTQGPATGTFELKRHKEVPAAPEPPPPYRQEEVTITSGDVTLAGTLTVPPSAGRHPAVVMITGSGPQNRDETIVGFKIFAVIADHLTRQGIAVLRCDDRGVGGSTGKLDESTTEDFAGDVMADIAYLKSRPDIDAKRIGLLGHSEGAIVAPMVASRSSDVAFVVLLSGPALTGEKIMLLQGERMLKAGGAGADVLAKQADTQRKLFAAARTNAGWEELSKQLSADVAAQAARLPDEQRKAMQQMGERQVAQQIKAVQSRWFRFFLDYDPLPALGRLRCPVLALFGELDLQVPPDVNQPLMAEAFAKSGNRAATTKVIAKANHLYQESKTGMPTEYGTLKKEFVPELLPLLSTWIEEQTGLKKTS